jgi:hypothetical protein
MHGALIMEAGPGYTLPSDLAALYNNAVHMHTLVLSLLNFAPAQTNVIDQFAIPNQLDLSTSFFVNQTLAPDPIFIGINQSDATFYVVNGLYQPTLTIPSEDVHVLRFIATSDSRFAELELVDPLNACTWTLLARDGVFQKTPYPTLGAVVLAPGTRADVAVKCSVSCVSTSFLVSLRASLPLALFFFFGFFLSMSSIYRSMSWLSDSSLGRLQAAASGQNIVIRSNPDPIRDGILGRGNRLNQTVVLTLLIREPSGTYSKIGSFPSSQASYPAYLTDLFNVSLQRVLKGGPLSGGAVTFAVNTDTNGMPVSLLF